MQKRKILITAAMAALTCQSTLSFAGRYDGPSVDVNFNAQEPKAYEECNQYENSTTKVYVACTKGLDAARRMAELYGGGHGQIEGYMQGYSWGMYKMARAYENDASQMDAGGQAIDQLQGQLQSGVAAGQQQAAADAGPRGQSDAIDRFNAVMNKNKDPDGSVRVPQTNYQGEDQGYEKYVGQITPIEQHLHDAKVTAIGAINFSTPLPHDLFSDYQDPNPWDLWFDYDHGKRAFERDRWMDPKLAWDVWLKTPNDARPDYDSLGEIPAVMGPSGQVVSPAIELKDVYAKSFQDAYGYYVNYYFSKAFGQNIDLGQLTGEQVGQYIGQSYAFQVGQERAFNRAFKQASQSSYRNAFVDAYTNSFESTFQDYLHNPKLSIHLEKIIGMDNDGIYQPGEKFKVQFVAQNMGGVGTPLSVSVGGSVVDQATQAFQIGRLQALRFTTDVIGTIDPKLHARDQATFVLNVNGLTDTASQEVQHIIEISSAPVARLNVSSGNGDIQVNAQNVSTARTSGVVVAILSINGRDVNQQQLGAIEGGNSFAVSMSIDHLDPLEVITGNTDARIRLEMNGNVLDETSVSLNPADRDGEMAKYFNELANSRGAVPATVGRDQRLADVLTRIASINEEQTKEHHSGPNVYKNSPSDLMIGKVVAEFHGSEQSPAARDSYDRLAREMWKARTNLRKFLFIRGPKRKAYENLVKELAKGKL